MTQIFNKFGEERNSLLGVTEDFEKFLCRWKPTAKEYDDFLEQVDVKETEHSNPIEPLEKKIHTIKEMLKREYIKISLFGRISSGKSAVANALLGSAILPSGCGHVSNCFVHLQGTDQQEGYFVTENEPGRQKPLQDLKDIASAIESGQTSTNSVVQVFWPKSKCQLLANGVVIIDSPGSELDDSLDEGIKNNCQDSDVFMLVVDGIGAISKSEIAFFRKIQKEISKANVFIVINKWDLSDEDKNASKVKKQHLRRCVNFLVDDTYVADEETAEDLIFFVSATEEMGSATEEMASATETIYTRTQYTDAQLERKNNFSMFKQRLESLASNSAVSLKIDPHLNSLLQICKDLQENNEKYARCLTQARESLKIKRSKDQQEHEAQKKEFETTKRSIETATDTTVSNYKTKILDAVQKIEDGITTVVTGFGNPGIKDANLDEYKKLLSENLLKHITNEIQVTSLESVLTETNELLSDINGLLRSFGPSEQRQRSQKPFDLILKIAIVSTDDLNGVKTENSIVPKVLKSAKYAAGLKNTVLGLVSATAAAAGEYWEEKIVSEFRTKYIENAKSLLHTKRSTYAQNCAAHLKQNLENKLKEVADQCTEKLNKVNFQTIDDLIEQANTTEQTFASLRTDLERIEGKLEEIRVFDENKTKTD